MMNSRINVPAAAVLGLALFLVIGANPPGQSLSSSPPDQKFLTYTLDSQVISAAGSPGVGPDVRLIGSLGQPTPVGPASTIGLQLHAGFWYTHRRAISGTAPPPLDTKLNRLVGARPNPFNPATEIILEVGSPTMVTLRIHDLQGRRIRTLLRERLSPGLHRVTWNGRDDSDRQLPSGVYFVSFTTGSKRQTSKVLLVK